MRSWAEHCIEWESCSSLALLSPRLGSGRELGLCSPTPTKGDSGPKDSLASPGGPLPTPHLVRGDCRGQRRPTHLKSLMGSIHQLTTLP